MAPFLDSRPAIGLAHMHGARRGRAWPGRWRGLARRVTAMLLTLCLGVFQLEALIADVCDGDASPAERAAWVGPASDLPAHVAALAATVDDGADAPPAGGAGGHATHVCHCVHSHGGVQSRPSASERSLVAVAVAIRPLAERAPSSVAPEPPLRPPAV